MRFVRMYSLATLLPQNPTSTPLPATRAITAPVIPNFNRQNPVTKTTSFFLQGDRSYNQYLVSSTDSLQSLLTPLTTNLALQSKSLPGKFLNLESVEPAKPAFSPVLNNADIYHKLSQSIEYVTSLGLTPVFASDIDGTIYDARKKTEAIIQDIAKHYHGKGSKRLKTLVSLGDVATARQQTVFLSTDNKIRPLGIYWDITEFSMETGFADQYPEVVPVLQKMYEKRFHNLSNWHAEHAIHDYVSFIQKLRKQNPDLVLMYCSLRGEADDIKPNGGSYTEEMLRAIGVFKDGDLFAFKPGASQPLPFDKISTRQIKEPGKADLINSRLLQSPNLGLIGFIDNDRKHIRYAFQDDTLWLSAEFHVGHSQFSSDSIVLINVPGDLPPDPRSQKPLPIHERVKVFALSKFHK